MSFFKDGNQIVSSDLIGEDGSTLNIQYIHADHAGIYSCQVRTLIDIISMDTELVVLKAEPIIQSVKGGVIRVMTGGNASIECVSSGIPAPSNKFRYKISYVFFFVRNLIKHEYKLKCEC